MFDAFCLRFAEKNEVKTSNISFICFLYDKYSEAFTLSCFVVFCS